jgi:maleate isomerase
MNVACNPENIMKFSSLTALKKVGHITPSSNTALEVFTSMMNAELSDRCSHHFSRLGVTAVRLDEKTQSQFSVDAMLEAARSLADAPLNSIIWNGTAGSWLGLEHDNALCAAITKETGLPASTATLAIHEILKSMGASHIALAVPYVSDLTNKILEVYKPHGVHVVSEAHLGEAVNHAIGSFSPDAIRNVLRASDSPEAQCIAVVCTNFAATPLVEEMEKELGKPIIDSTAAAFWKGCRLAGIDPIISGWGALMRGDLIQRL